MAVASSHIGYQYTLNFYQLMYYAKEIITDFNNYK